MPFSTFRHARTAAIRALRAAPLAVFATAIVACSGAGATADAQGSASQEVTSAHGRKHAARFARADVNGDGVLRPEEVGERRWSFLKSADANQDGAVSQEELQQAFADGKLGRGGRGHGPHGDGAHKRHGHRGGPFSPEKLKERFGNAQGEVELSALPDRMQRRLASADTNQDGKLSDDELRAHRESWRARRAQKSDVGAAVEGGAPGSDAASR
jgi:hypothetical protein